MAQNGHHGHAAVLGFSRAQVVESSIESVSGEERRGYGIVSTTMFVRDDLNCARQFIEMRLDLHNFRTFLIRSPRNDLIEDKLTLDRRSEGDQADPRSPTEVGHLQRLSTDSWKVQTHECALERTRTHYQKLGSLER